MTAGHGPLGSKSFEKSLSVIVPSAGLGLLQV